MFKKTIGYLVALIGGAVAFIFGSGLIRRKVSGDNDSIGELRQGIRESRDIHTEAKGVTGAIESDNHDARKGIRTALDILKGIEKTDSLGKD